MDKAKNDHYRAQAAQAQAMAGRTNSAVDKAAWLSIAQGWLGMIRNPPEQASFDAKATKSGTGQDNSEESH